MNGRTKTRRQSRNWHTLRAPIIAAAILISPLLAPPAVAQVSQMEQTAVVCPVDADYVQPLALGREVLGSRACFACHLQGTASFAIEGDQLTLSDDAGQMLLEFSGEPSR